MEFLHIADLLNYVIAALGFLAVWLLNQANRYLKEIRNEVVLHGRDIAVHTVEIGQLKEKQDHQHERLNNHSDRLKTLEINQQKKN